MPPLVAAAVIGAAGTAYGAHRAGRSADRARDVQAQADADMIRLERERDAEARRQWEADQAFQAKQFAAQEEQRQFERAQAEYQQQLQRDREARQAPYRQASAAALGRLGDMLGLPLGAASSASVAPASASSAAGAAPTFGNLGAMLGIGGGMPTGPLPARLPSGSGMSGAVNSMAPGGITPMGAPLKLSGTLADQLNLRSRRPLQMPTGV